MLLFNSDRVRQAIKDKEISIHLMLLFNPVLQDQICRKEDFNTSNVTIQPDS